MTENKDVKSIVCLVVVPHPLSFVLAGSANRRDARIVQAQIQASISMAGG
jgi:hypothetical protein